MDLDPDEEFIAAVGEGLYLGLIDPEEAIEQGGFPRDLVYQVYEQGRRARQGGASDADAATCLLLLLIGLGLLLCWLLR